MLAAGGVFLSHIAVPAALPEVTKTFMASGYNGVTLFFILSGFVLAWTYGDKILPLRPGTLWSFAVARFARVYPLYLFALLAVIAPVLAAGRGDPLMLLHGLALQPWSSHVERAYAYNGPGWSIGVEVFLYACFPFLVLALAKIRKSNTALVLVAIGVIVCIFSLTWWFVITGRADASWAAADSAHRWLYRTPLTRLGDFALGMIAAFSLRNCRVPAWAARIAQFGGAFGIVALMCSPSVLFTAWSWDAAYVIPASLLLWGLAAGPTVGLARPLSTRPMVLLGEASFAFYILHWLFLGTLTPATDNVWAWFVGTAVQFTLILLVAVGAHTVIERPLQRWLRRNLDRQVRPPEETTPVESEDLVAAGSASRS